MAGHTLVRSVMVIAALMSAAALGGCGGGTSFSLDPSDWFSGAGSSSSSSSSSSSGLGFTVFQGAVEAPAKRPVTAADLIGPDGRCEASAASPEPAAAPPATPATTPAAAPDTGAQPAPVALPPRGVGLTMTECELVAVAGTPENINLGVDESGNRRAVLTYTKGDHPGIYTFVSGRLKVMEQLPTPPKPERRKRTPRKRRA